MSCLLKTNAYHVLGLDTLASEKEILKRAKEINNRLKIEDFPEYDLDLTDPRTFRSEEAVRSALQLLQTPKKRIREYFFWYRIADSVDEQAAALLKQKKFAEAIAVWRDAAKEDTTKALFYKKNLAVLFSTLLCLENNLEYLRSSLENWKSIFESEKFWISFSKAYKLQDVQTASDEMLLDFKAHSTEYLSDIYSELSDLYGAPVYMQEFRQIFSSKGEKIEKNILDPAFQAINDAVEKLEAMKVSEDGKFDQDEANQISALVGLIKSELNKLIDLGLFEDSQTKIVRDRAANGMRTIVLDLHNNLDETTKAIALLKVALKIAGTTGLIAKINQEILTLEEQKSNAAIIKPVVDLVAAEQYEKAWQLIKAESPKYENVPDLKEFYSKQAKFCVSMMAIQRDKRAHEFLKNKQEDTAKVLFLEAGQLIYGNIELYSFNKEAIDKLLLDVRENAAKVNSKNLGQLDEYRNSFIKLAKEKFPGQLEEVILMTLIDACLFSAVADLMKKTREKIGVINMLNVFGWLTIWFYGAGLVFWIVAWFYKNTD